MTDEAVARDELVEAFAWWHTDLPEGQAVVAEAATNALLAGLDGAALAELAGIPKDENPFEVDVLIGRVASALEIDPERWAAADLVASRRMCRQVLAGKLSERELSRWVHSRFHHESDFEPLNELALLVDDYDDAEYAGADPTPIQLQIREVATAIAG